MKSSIIISLKVFLQGCLYADFIPASQYNDPPFTVSVSSRWLVLRFEPSTANFTQDSSGLHHLTLLYWQSKPHFDDSSRHLFCFYINAVKIGGFRNFSFPFTGTDFCFLCVVLCHFHYLPATAWSAVQLQWHHTLCFWCLKNPNHFTCKYEHIQARKDVGYN